MNLSDCYEALDDGCFVLQTGELWDYVDENCTEDNVFDTVCRISSNITDPCKNSTLQFTRCIWDFCSFNSSLSNACEEDSKIWEGSLRVAVIVVASTFSLFVLDFCFDKCFGCRPPPLPSDGSPDVESGGAELKRKLSGDKLSGSEGDEKSTRSTESPPDGFEKNKAMTATTPPKQSLPDKVRPTPPETHLGSFRTLSPKIAIKEGIKSKIAKQNERVMNERIAALDLTVQGTGRATPPEPSSSKNRFTPEFSLREDAKKRSAKQAERLMKQRRPPRKLAEGKADPPEPPSSKNRYTPEFSLREDAKSKLAKQTERLMKERRAARRKERLSQLRSNKDRIEEWYEERKSTPGSPPGRPPFLDVIREAVSRRSSGVSSAEFSEEFRDENAAK